MNKQMDYIIFTDASARRANDTEYCAYGVVILNTHSKQYVTFGGELSNHTIVFGEAWAIYRGMQKTIELARRNSDKMVRILVVTDSKLSVNVFSYYIPRAWDLSDPNKWRKKDGKPVKNQELYQRIWRLMKSDSKLYIRFTHMHSHLKNKDTGWSDTAKTLSKYGVNVEDVTASMFIKMNELADEIASSLTKKMIERESKYGKFILLKKERVPILNNYERRNTSWLVVQIDYIKSKKM